MRWTHWAAGALCGVAAACGGGGGGSGGGASPASVDARLVGSYEAWRWFYDYSDGTRIGNEDFDSTTWRLRLEADGTYDLYKDWWKDGDFRVKHAVGTWATAPANDPAADGTLLLTERFGEPCTEAYPFELPDDPDVALAFWASDGPTCDPTTKPYVFYRVEWTRTE